jgi:cell division protein FtsQ
MSVAELRLRPGGWFASSKGKRKSGFVTTALKSSKPARNVSKGSEALKGASLGNFAIILVRVIGWLISILFVVVLLGAISLGLIYGYRTLTSSDHFAVSRVEISGNKQLSSSEILSLSGISIGASILEVSLGDMGRKLQGNPWVESVAVRRILPNGVAIEVAEREPFFWVQQAGVLYYADRNGSPIAPLEPGRFVSLPTLIIDDGAKPNWRMLTEWIQAMELLEFPFRFSEIAWLKVEDANILRIFLEEKGMVIHFELNGWQEHREILHQVWEDLLAREELEKVARLTVMSGKAWVQTKQP